MSHCDGILQDATALTRSAALVLVHDTPKGRGIFARSFIPASTILETCPVLVLGAEENKQHVEKTSLYHYTYNWPSKTPSGKPAQTQAVILGLGSMFNHSSGDQNVGWVRDVDRLLITYRALRDIEIGEELCISYGARLTFVDADAPAPVNEGDGAEIFSEMQLGLDG